MTASTVGLLHPGAMGASVGAALAASGRRVLWASAGRSAATAERAGKAGLEDAADLAGLVGASEVVFSVCPPAAAVEVAERVVALGFRGLYVDGNAVSPATARKIAAVCAEAGAGFVDGGIVGPPAWKPGTTRLHLSGERAAAVAAAFEGTPFDVRVVPGGPGRASALKMVFAGWTKGSTALLAALYATARAEGVEAEILAEWERFVPDLPGRLRAGVPGSARKAWRFGGEMREIAATLEEAGLPPEFHRAAGEIFDRLAGFKDADPAPSPEDIADALVRSR